MEGRAERSTLIVVRKGIIALTLPHAADQDCRLYMVKQLAQAEAAGWQAGLTFSTGGAWSRDPVQT